MHFNISKINFGVQVPFNLHLEMNKIALKILQFMHVFAYTNQTSNLITYISMFVFFITRVQEN